MNSVTSITYELLAMCLIKGRYDQDEAERILSKYYANSTAAKYKYKYRYAFRREGYIDNMDKPTDKAVSTIISALKEQALDFEIFIREICKSIMDLHEEQRTLWQKLHECEQTLAKMRPLDTIIDVAFKLGLTPEWAAAVIALTLQEIAIKKKLDQLGIYSHEREFPELVKQLRKALADSGKAFPLKILTSISRSQRDLRAKVVHEGHRHLEDLPVLINALIETTRSLVTILFEE